MIKHLHTLCMLLALLVLPTGCIKEDLDDCDNVSISFQYLADENQNVLPDYVTKVDLYVFDENERILEVRTYTGDELRQSNTTPTFRLTHGKRYKMVAVANDFDATDITNIHITGWKNIFIQNPAWNTDKPVTTHDDNYMGQAEFTMPAKEGMRHHETITLFSAHIDVKIEMHGLPAPNSPNGEIPYEIRIENANAQCAFTNEVNADPSRKETVYPILVFDNNRQCYQTNDLALFRMDHNGTVDPERCKHVVVVTDKKTGEELKRFNVYDFVTQNTGKLDITRQEAVLPVCLAFDQLDVTIKLPDWFIEDITPDWN